MKIILHLAAGAGAIIGLMTLLSWLNVSGYKAGLVVGAFAVWAGTFLARLSLAPKVDVRPGDPMHETRRRILAKVLRKL